MLFATVGNQIVDQVSEDMQDREIDKDPDELSSLRDPRIVIKKKARVLEIYDGARMVKSYRVVVGFMPEGNKEKEGDGRTPEGEFYIFTKNSQSKFHLSLGISYPSRESAARGLASEIITMSDHDEIARAIEDKKMPPQKTALGGEIYIHGGGVDRDWTHGCIALNNEDVEEIYNAVEVGTTVVIRP